MQVISGKYRKRKLNTLEGRNTRPTSSRVKEDMFNILNNYFIYDDKVVIDLFSGSAALGIETLSRGAKFCYFNDHNSSAINIIKNNLANLQIKDYYLTNYDYNDCLRYLINKNISADLIFLDPPFKQINYYYDTVNIIVNDSGLLNNYGIIICQSEQSLDVSSFNVTVLKYKQYKNKHLYLLRKEDE